MHRVDAQNLIYMARATLNRHRGGYVDVDGYRELSRFCATLAQLIATPEIHSRCKELDRLARRIYGSETSQADLAYARAQVLDFLDDMEKRISGLEDGYRPA
jgi:hypothetical protein